jgi:hypothetical protein
MLPPKAPSGTARAFVKRRRPPPGQWRQRRSFRSTLKAFVERGSRAAAPSGENYHGRVRPIGQCGVKWLRVELCRCLDKRQISRGNKSALDNRRGQAASRERKQNLNCRRTQSRAREEQVTLR